MEWSRMSAHWWVWLFWDARSLLCSQIPPYQLDGTYTHWALELLRGEIIMPKRHLFFCHHPGLTQGRCLTQGSINVSSMLSWACYLHFCLSAAVFTDSIAKRRLEKTIQCRWRVSVWQWPRTDFLLVDLNSLKANFGWLTLYQGKLLSFFSVHF